MKKLLTCAVFAAGAIVCECLWAADQWKWTEAKDGNADAGDEVWTKQSGNNSAYIFNCGGAFTVGLGADFAKKCSIYVGGDTAVTLDLAPYAWTCSNNPLTLPYTASLGGNPSVTLKSGALNDVRLDLGTKAEGPGGEMTLTGAGTSVKATAVNVGTAAPNARLTVGDGASITAGDTINVGSGAGSDGAKMEVKGGATVSSSATSGISYLGNGSSFNEIVVSGTESSLSFGNKVQFRIGVGANSSSNRLEVNGGKLTCGNNLVVGMSASFNEALVTNGASCELTKVYVGGQVGADCNHMLVSGPGTEVTSGELYSGRGGNSNLLEVADGALWTASLVSLNYGALSGTAVGAPSFGNRIVVRGAGSKLVVPGNNVFVGYTNGLARLTVRDGAMFVSTAGTGKYTDIGYQADTADNEFLVENGCVTNSTMLRIGHAKGAFRNSVRVTGADALWRQIVSDAYVGNHGSLSTLTIEDGATFAHSTAIVLGNYAESCSNLVKVAGTGTTLTDTTSSGANITVGQKGSFNRLVFDDASTNEIKGTLSIGGSAGSENRLEVLNGASLYVAKVTSLPASDGTGTNNTILVDNAALDLDSSAGGDNYPTLVMGKGALLDLRGGKGTVHAPLINMNDASATLRFTGDRFGMPALTVSKGTKGHSSFVKIVANKGGKIEIDGSRCGVRLRDHLLISSSNAIPDSLLENVVTSENVTWKTSDDKKKLYVDVKVPGLMLLLR